jgi:uncharacterized RDD family membrane protein YckC
VRLDPALRAETPEGIEIELQPAGLQARTAALFVDVLLRVVFLNIVYSITNLFHAMGMGVYLVIAFVVEWLYPVAFELAPGSATPGKRIMGLRVVMADGLPVTVAASLSRNLLRAADFLPFMYALGAVCVLTRRDFRRLGDLVADTLVVHVQPPRNHALPPGLEPVPPPVPLAPEARAALMHLALRAGRINAERLDEVAALAAPACGEAAAAAALATGPAPALTRRVLGVGYWLLGGRSA